MKKSQVAMEYMMVVGFSLLLVIPIIMIYGTERQSMNTRISVAQADNIARKITDAAESVYYLGRPAKTTLKIYMPPNVESVTLSDREVIFVVGTSPVSTEVVRVSDVNMSGTVSPRPGIQYIEIVADDYVVNVTTLTT